MVETDGEERVAREGQALATRCDMDDAVPRRVPAGQLCDHARRHFALLVEGHDLVGIGIDELRRGLAQNLGKGVWPSRMVDVGGLPESKFGGRDMEEIEERTV